MLIRSVELKDYRNYKELNIEFDEGINIIFGKNAQGKTNILEALYVACTSGSHRSVKDRDLIRFGQEEAHIKLKLEKNNIPRRIDVHIKKNRPKGIAIDGIPIHRVSELFGTAGVLFFSPEDLSIIKNGPAERRRFLDLELCQLNRLYTHSLISYNRVLNQKNRLLKNAAFHDADENMLDVYDEQLITYGNSVIQIRWEFTQMLNRVIKSVHQEIAPEEEISLQYEPDASDKDFKEKLKVKRNAEIKQQMCLVGPQRDDLRICINGEDLRHYGSQGQQRTAALSLKLAEIKIYEEFKKEKPVLLLDDVLSELDRDRQKMLLKSIKDIQTIISCTGLDDFIAQRVKIDRIFEIKDKKATVLS